MQTNRKIVIQICIYKYMYSRVQTCFHVVFSGSSTKGLQLKEHIIICYSSLIGALYLYRTRNLFVNHFA